MESRTIFALAALALAEACGSPAGHAAKGPGGPGVAFGTKGPWPVQNDVYGAGQGILESPVVGVTTDEAQNRWVATPDALYLLRPGDTRFHRYDASDGLHLGGNMVRYCDDHPIGSSDPCRGELSAGAGLAITRIVGGAPDEGRQAEIVRYLGEAGQALARLATGNQRLPDELKARILNTFLTLMNLRENMDRAAARLKTRMDAANHAAKA